MLAALLLAPAFLVPFLVPQVAGTEFCQCEAPQYFHTFTGIQHICKDLPDEWCSTKCDFFYGACNYCQYQPAGHGPDKDYQRLKDWCSSQSDYDSATKRTFRGTDVFCYSRKNAVDRQFGGKGCDYQDNGDDPRDKTAYLRLRRQSGWFIRRGCSNLMFTDWPELVKGFIGQNQECVEINNATAAYTIECPKVTDGNINIKRLKDFKSYCQSLKGNWYQRHDGPDFLTVEEEAALQEQEEVEAMQSWQRPQHPLPAPQRYPPRLSTKENMIDTVDVPEEEVERGSIGETRRVVFEEDDFRITVVEEE